MPIIYIVILFFTLSCSTQFDKSNTFKFGEEIAVADMVAKSDYVIYSDTATLPTLYNTINLLTHNKPSFMYMGRKGTIVTTKLPSHVQMVSSPNAMRTKIAELNRENPQATFTFYVNDMRIAQLVSFFYSQGIDASRVKTVMLSDGTLTYVQWNGVYLGMMNSFLIWEHNQSLIQKAIDNAQNIDENAFANDGKALAAPTVAENISFWLQWPEFLQTDSISLQSMLKHSGNQYKKVDPQKYFESLSASAQQKFMELVELDKVWASGEKGGTLNNQTIGQALDASPKPNIIITGTTPYSPAGKNTDKLIAKVKSIYGNGYDYFYKGHPRDTTKPSDKSITVLPFILPMEAILWVHGKDIAVLGGYESSLYMNADKKIDKFFFEKSGSDLLDPLNTMYHRGLLGKVKFIN